MSSAKFLDYFKVFSVVNLFFKVLFNPFIFLYLLYYTFNVEDSPARLGLSFCIKTKREAPKLFGFIDFFFFFLRIVN